MSDQGYPVTVAVTRPDGSVEQVRVGTAFKSGEGFSLSMGELAIGGTPDKAGAGAPRRQAGGGAGGGPVFPPYGRSKGAPIYGASQGDLEYYANGCRRTLGDPGKARFHEKEKALLAAIEAEIARQGGAGGGNSGEPPPPGDEDAPF
ncbi:MAG: hypothetical protein ACYC8T_17795 [Myxococcaceae bacterium]